MLKVLDKAELTHHVAVVMGTRPGIIKLSPVVRALESKGAAYFVIHTGQHYTYNMDRKFFEDLRLPEPAFKITTTSQYRSHGGQTAEMLRGVEEVLLRERPWVVIVCGDANTNLAGALAARKLGIAVAHVEAGLRSGDWRMPEEHNRIMIDHISEFLFPPTAEAAQNLRLDNVAGRIEVVGNTIVDAVQQHLELASERTTLVNDLGLKNRKYILVTIHREENVDSEQVLGDICEGLEQLEADVALPLLFPMHPRTKERIDRFNLATRIDSLSNTRVIDPVGYLDFIALMANASCVVTDSGGIQEEACVLQVPCVTVRGNTERPETVRVGANTLAGTKSNRIVAAVKTMLSARREWTNPFGDGRTGERIVDCLLSEHSENDLTSHRASSSASRSAEGEQDRVS